MSLTSTTTNCREKSTPEEKAISYLFAFDFDHTVVNDNSDCVITSLAKCPVPPEIKNFYDGTNWTEYMNKVFQFLHEQGVTVNDICRLVKNMEGTKGIVPLLKFLVSRKESSTNPKINLMIISDANDLFISEFLRAQVLDSPNLNDSPVAQERQLPFDIITNMVITNSTTSNLPVGPMNNNSSTTTPLQISPYEHQTSCKICPKNLCKGSALQKYIKEHGPFTRIFYTGDGKNDICPSTSTLSQSDYVFVRKNYAMHKHLMKSENSLEISATVIIWEDGEEIKKVIEDVLQK